VVHQPGALAPHRFRDQEVGSARQHQGGRVELNEFEIAHLGAGLPGHRHPVAGGLGRVGGFLEQVAAAAAGEHHGPGPQPAHLQAIENLQTLAAAPFDPEFQGQQALALLQQRAPLGLPLEGVHQGSAGAVLGMQHPAVAVGGLQGGAQTSIAAIERHAELQQALDTGRRLANEQFNGLGIAETGTGLERVLAVAREAVFRPGHRRDAPLGPAAGRERCSVLADQQHPQANGKFQAGHQPGGAATDHHHIPMAGQERLRSSVRSHAASRRELELRAQR